MDINIGTKLQHSMSLVTITHDGLQVFICTQLRRIILDWNPRFGSVNLDLLELDVQVFAKCFVFIGFHKLAVSIESVKWDVERF